MLMLLEYIGTHCNLILFCRYMAITSQWVVTKRLKEMFPYMARAKSSIEHYWMVSPLRCILYSSFLTQLLSYRNN